jgi:drug/metabolite transporter (DMT)-like permease
LSGIYLKLLATALFWGGTFVAGRDLAQHMGPFCASFLRFAAASVLLLALVYRYEGGLPRLGRGQWLLVGLLGATGVFAYNAFFFMGLKIVPAGRAAVVVALNPVFIALGGALFFQERLRGLRLAGVLLSVAGAVTTITHGAPWTLLSQGVGWGDLLILGCVGSWASYTLLGRSSMRALSPHAAVTYSCLAGVAMLLPPALAEGLPAQFLSYPAVAWLDVVYLGACGTVLGFTWYYEGVKALGPGRASVFINFVPLFAILSGWLLLGESVHPSLLLGAGMVCCGAYLTNAVKS